MTRKQIHVRNADIARNIHANSHDESITQAKIRDFAHEVSIVGVRNLADSSTHVLSKMIWTVLLLFGFCLAIYQIQERICLYLRYPVQTETDIVQAQELKFPQITMCNENTVRKSVAKKYGE